MLGIALGGVALIYAFIVTVDPFDILPLSPPLARAPISTNARFSFPGARALAKIRQRRDRHLNQPPAAAGDSRSGIRRTLREFGHERGDRVRAGCAFWDCSHAITPDARVVIIGLDIAWCGIGDVQKYTPRPFPEWMFGDGRWRGYRELFNIYALTEAVAQFAHVTGLKRSRYGLDGYTSFVPDDSEYDRARVALHLKQDAAAMGGAEIGGSPATWRFASLSMLRAALGDLSPRTSKVLYFARTTTS